MGSTVVGILKDTYSINKQWIIDLFRYYLFSWINGFLVRIQLFWEKRLMQCKKKSIIDAQIN